MNGMRAQTGAGRGWRRGSDVEHHAGERDQMASDARGALDALLLGVTSGWRRGGCI
jgi:hypothetical protein